MNFFDNKIPAFIAGKLGYEQTMLMNNLSPEVLLNPEHIWHREKDERLVINKIKEMETQDRAPTAIISEMGLINEHLVSLLSRNGYAVPKDISLICVGENVEYPSLHPFGIKRLTLMIPPLEKMADAAVESIISRMNKTKFTGGLTAFNPVVMEGDTVRDLSRGKQK